MFNTIISDLNSPQIKRILHIALALSTSTGAQWLWGGYPTFSNNADEPTGALDHDNSLRVIAHLRDLADGGASVVVATHSDLVADSADQHIKVA